MEHAWYTMGAAGQEGPFEPAQLVGMFDRGDLAWTDDVWRPGLRDWRPARKDDVLVVAVAGARGLDTATMRLDALPALFESQPATRGDDTLVDVIPAGLTSSWPLHPALPPTVRTSRTSVLARGLKLATLALLAFVGGGLIVGLVGRMSQLARPAQVDARGSSARERDAEAAPLSVASASMVSVAPVRPSSGERVKRTLPALDEVRAELTRLASSARLCARDPKLGIELALTIAGASGRPRQIEVLTPHMTPGQLECTKSALAELRVAPFTADELYFDHHYTW
ncbi:MAG TPA: DUF4339 domain-containing protein [Polyangiales bacterium]|nr:DUF4339 domain-containing protein [Polyangiales bacterium]